MNQQQFEAEMDGLAKLGLIRLFEDAAPRKVNGMPYGGQSAVAECLGIGRAAVSKWEAVPINHLPTLCRVYGGSGRRYRPDLFDMPKLLKLLLAFHSAPQKV